MAGKTNITATYFAQKKLLGKANTSILKKDYEESISTNIQTNASIIFGETVTDNPTQTLYWNDSIVEYVEFELDAVSGTAYQATSEAGGEGTQESGVHAYRLKFPTGYAATTNSGKTFQDGEYIHEYLGRAQLVPTFYSELVPNPYNVKLYDANGVQIPLADEVDWSIDYYNGILFLQDYDVNKIPATARAFIYIGEYLDDALLSAAASGDLNYIQSTSSGYLSATGSMSFSGGEGYSFNTSDVGSDTFFFVSGSLDGQNKSVFGGDVVVSGSLSVSSNNILEHNSIIKNQYNTIGLDKEFTILDSDTGNFLKRDFKSSFYAKGGPNSTINFIVPLDTSRYAFNANSQGRDYNSVFINYGYRRLTSNINGQQDDIMFIFDKDVLPSSYSGPPFDFTQRNEEYIFDAAKASSQVETLADTNANGLNIQHGSFLADVTPEFNYSFWLLYGSNNTSYNIANYVEGIPRNYPGNDPFGYYYRYEFSDLLDTNNKTVTINKYHRHGSLLDSFPLSSYFSEAKDVTREILEDISDSSLDATLLNYYSISSWASKEEKFNALMAYYVRSGQVEKVKLGTKLSSNRYEELKAFYQSFTATDDAQDGNLGRIVSTGKAGKSMNTVLFSLIDLINSEIQIYNNNNPTSTQINEFNSTNNATYTITERNGDAIPWDFYLEIGYPFSSFSFKVSIQKLGYLYYKELSDTFDELINYYTSIKSSIGTINAFELIKSNEEENSGYSGYVFLLKRNAVYESVKNYEEYRYYQSVFVDSPTSFDVTKRDFVDNTTIDPTSTNYQGVVLGRNTSGAEPESVFNRNKMITVLEPALLVTGSAVFLDPISVKKIYGQSPIEVNTVFEFGTKTVLTDDEGTPLTGSSGQLLYNDNTLTIGPRGILGNTQITGSVDITGFGPQDGMRINMGNLTMTTDINGFNMPVFSMVNTNDMPYERPQILMSNNISSFLSGTKSYQMGEISFAGPRYDSPEDDKENITIRAQINEEDNALSVNYLAFDFYINEERNRFKNADGTIPEENQKQTVLAIGQFSNSQVENENEVSVGMGIRGNIIPLGVYDYSDVGTQTLVSTDNTLGNERFRWGALHLGEESPITFGNLSTTKARLNFDYVGQQLSFSGSVRFDHGLTGSLTKLSDGTDYLRGIDGVTVSTGSSGEVYVGLEGYTTGSERITTEVYSQTGLSGSQVTFSQQVFELANYNDNNIKFYLNGQLLSSGSLQEVSVDKTRDYFIDPDAGSVYFADPIYSDDVLSSVFYNDTSDQRGQYRYDRILSTAQAAGTNVWFNFDFGIIDYDYDKFEVFVNGQQLTRIDNLSQGETQPYEITASNRIAFDHDLYARDIITLLFKIPNPFSTSSSDGDGEEESELNSKIKETVNITQDYQALDPVSFTSLSFDLDTYSKDVLNVYHNGQLLMPGSLYHAQVGRADYFIQDDTIIKFADILRSGDVITFDLLVPGYENAFADTVFVTQNKSLLNNTLQLSGSNSILVETTAENIIIKNNKELVFNEILIGNVNGVNNIFQLSNEPFSPSEISIFVDGVLKIPSGSTTLFDYSVNGSQITFNSQSTPSSGSLVMSIYNKVI